MWTYEQTTGALKHNGKIVAKGYSGTGAGRDNPTAQALRNLGPIPAGRYSIGDVVDDERLGPIVLALHPDGHNACGRSGFYIHGDNAAHNASHGCIIVDRSTRILIARSHDQRLVVTA